jgi:hypothetical protein
MRRSNFDLPRHPVGAVFIHDDAVWIAGETESFRAAFIRREDDTTWSLITQADQLAIQKRIQNVPFLTEARRALRRHASKLRALAR